MRRLIVLAACAAVIVLLALTYAALAPEESAEPAPVTPAESYRMLYTRNQADFASMTVTLASGETYTVDSSLGFDEQGNLLGVYNNLGQPVVLHGQEDFALDTTSFQMMLLTAVNLPVTASYPALDEASCGLTSPAARIEISYHTGEPITLSIGSKTASGYSCYVKMAGDDSVHLVPADFYDVMTLPLKGHHRLATALSCDASQAAQIAVVQDGVTFLASNYTGEGRILTWQVEKPYVHAGSKERIEAFVTAVCAIHADAYEATVSTAEELAVYGLAEPTRLLAAFSDGTIRDIHIGNDAGDGTVYARLDSTGDVYRVSAAQLPTLLQTGTDELLDRFVALVAVADMNVTTVYLTDTGYVLAQVKDGSGAVLGQTINGDSVATDVFSGCYAAIVGMQFDKVAASAPTGELVAGVRFDLADGSTKTIAYYAYDEHYVQAVTSTGGSFLLRRERLDSMLTTLKEAHP